MAVALLIGIFVDVKVEKLKYEYFSRIRMSLKVLYENT